MAAMNDVKLLQAGVEGPEIKQHPPHCKPFDIPAHPLWVRQNSIKQIRS